MEINQEQAFGTTSYKHPRTVDMDDVMGVTNRDEGVTITGARCDVT